MTGAREAARAAGTEAGVTPTNLPNFFIAAAQKAGTTSLFRYLVQHPDIYIPSKKEMAFFLVDSLYEKGLDFYAEEYFSEAGGYRARGDATANYLIDETVARRIRKDLPRASQRFILIFREPVERAYSAYWWAVRETFEELSFEKALATEAQRIEAWRRRGERWWWIAYYRNGCYATNLGRYLQYFDRSQFLYLLYDDLVEDPLAVSRQAFDFLGVDSGFTPDTSGRYNPASLPRSRAFQRMLNSESPLRSIVRSVLPADLRARLGRSMKQVNMKPFDYPPMDPETRHELAGRYREEIERLMDLIGRDLSHWLNPGRAPVPRAAGDRGGPRDAERKHGA